MKPLLVSTLLAIFAAQLCALEISELLALEKAKEATRTALDYSVNISQWLPEVYSQLDAMDTYVRPDADSYKLRADFDKNVLQLMCSALMDNLQAFQGTPLEGVVLKEFAPCMDTESMANLSADDVTEIKVQLRMLLLSKGFPLLFMFLKPIIEWVFK